MGQLVRQGVHPAGRVGRELAGLEDDVGANGVGLGVDRRRGLIRLRAGVDAAVAEIVSQAPLPAGPARPVQRRPATPADYLAHRGRLLRFLAYQRADTRVS